MKCLRIFFLGLVLLLSNSIRAQVTDSTDINDPPEQVYTPPADSVQAIDWKAIKRRLVYGGSLGLSFYSPFTIFQISPQIGYKLYENTIVGTGIQLFGVTSKQNSYFQYGPDFFIRQHLFNILFLQAQFEYINFENYILPGKRIWNPGMLVGFGYGTYGYSLGLYTNLIQNANSELIYPGHLYIGPKPQTGYYPYGVPFFFRGQLLF